jgi:hypothetical protein
MYEISQPDLYNDFIYWKPEVPFLEECPDLEEMLLETSNKKKKETTTITNNQT